MTLYYLNVGFALTYAYIRNCDLTSKKWTVTLYEKSGQIPRAKRRKSILTVLFGLEVTALIEQLMPPYRLIGMLPYGCDLRLSEALYLRLHNFNFDTGMLSAQFGKG